LIQARARAARSLRSSDASTEKLDWALEIENAPKK
jgi:hypothetical protein